MQARVQKWGNSLAVRIPESFASQSQSVVMLFGSISIRKRAVSKPANVRRLYFRLHPTTEKWGWPYLCPITNKIKGYPFEVNVPEDLDITGTILSDQIKSLGWKARNATFICKLSDESTEQVLATAATLLR